MATSTMAYAPVAVRASWDTNPSPKPPTLKPNKTFRLPPHAPPPPPPSATPTLGITSSRTAALEKDFSLLLNASRRSTSKKEDDIMSAHWHIAGMGNSNEQYMGYEAWLPVAPKVNKPSSIYNAASLAYLGDCIYEDLLLKKLIDEDYLTEEERDILRWGKNIVSSKTRTRKRVGVAVYNRASSFETLVGFLYLTNVKRLEEIMFKLGFLTGASSVFIVEELCKNLRKEVATSEAVHS